MVYAVKIVAAAARLGVDFHECTGACDSPPDSPDTAYALFLRTQRALPDSAHMLEPLQAKAQRGVVDIASLGQNEARLARQRVEETLVVGQQNAAGALGV